MKRYAYLLPFLPVLLGSPAQAGFASLSEPAVEEATPPQLVLSLRSNSVYSVLEAAAMGDVTALEARLAEGENPCQVDEEGNSPLHYAAMGKSARLLQLLLDAGADPTARDASGHTPRELCHHAPSLHLLQQAEERRKKELAACTRITRADVAAVRAALAKGLNPNARSADNEGTLLLYAVSLGHASVVNALLEAGADVNAATSHSRRTSLHIAAAHGDIPVLRLLLAAKANPLLQSSNGAYPLHDAIWGLKLEATRLLLPAYAPINFSPKGGPHGSPLAMAINYGREEYVRAFLEAGFNPNDTRLTPEPPLHQAVRSGHESCIKLLLAAGADKQMPDASGKTAADYASPQLAPLLR